MEKTPLVPQDTAVRVMGDAMRLRVGLGKRHSFASLADATGISERTLRSYVDGATPGFGHYLSLCAVLGPVFASEMLAVAGLVAREGSQNEPEHKRLLTSITAVAAQLAEALEDDVIDHQEAASLRPVAAALIQMLEPLTRCEGTVPFRGIVGAAE